MFKLFNRPRHYRIVETTGAFYPQYKGLFGWRSIGIDTHDDRYATATYEQALDVIMRDKSNRSPWFEGIVKITEID